MHIGNKEVIVLQVGEKGIAQLKITAIVTTIVPGVTDNYWYMRHSTKKQDCIGFTPMRIPLPQMKFSSLFHGTNERIPVEGFK